MTNFLVISALGDDQPGIVEKLSRAILEYDCNIEDSRMSILGGTFAIIQLVSGRWNNLAKLESALANLEKQLHLTIVTKRTLQREPPKQVLPYTVDVVSLDHSGIVSHLAAFLAIHGINIQEMTTSTYKAAHTATPMISIRMTIEIPASLHITQLREEFLDLCDEQNFDGVIEPIKA
ncbi:MAG: glycine cleavage system protein R [Pseudomonadota bacterium]